MRTKYHHRSVVRSYYRYQVIRAMRDAGHTLRTIADYFWISSERVRQILKRGPVSAQLTLTLTRNYRDLVFPDGTVEQGYDVNLD